MRSSDATERPAVDADFSSETKNLPGISEDRFPIFSYVITAGVAAQIAAAAFSNRVAVAAIVPDKHVEASLLEES